MATLHRLPETTHFLLRELKSANPNDPTLLSKSRKIAPEQIESAFDHLNDAFSFNESSGQLTRNSAVQFNSDEEQVVQQLLAGYQRQVQAGEIKLQRGANQRYIPLTAEPEEEHQGVVTRIPSEQVNSAENLSQQQEFLDLSLASSESGELSNLLAQGCGWQWWKKKYWWGIRISLNKTAVNWLASGATAVAAILAAMGISGIAAVAIKALAGILKLISNENGIRIYATWTGIFWATPKPTSSGGC